MKFLPGFILSISLLLLFAASCTNSAQPEQKSKPAVSGETNDTSGNKTTKAKLPGDLVLNHLFRYNSEEELKAAFGSDVSRGIDYLPEGMGSYPVSVLYKGTPNEVKINWLDTVAFKSIARIVHEGSASQWHTAQQVKLGTTLAEIEALNGKPFTFYGFGWDYAGAVQWKGGKLDDTGLFVRLIMPDNNAEKIKNSFLGDKEFKSNDPLAAKANITVGYISLDK